MRDVPFATVDVFTDQRFAGNPLAVILDARGLSDSEMQQIAAEFGYSETTFVLPPQDFGQYGQRPDIHAGHRSSVRRTSECRNGLRPR